MNEYYYIKPILKEGEHAVIGHYETLEKAMEAAKSFLNECNNSDLSTITEIRFYHTKIKSIFKKFFILICETSKWKEIFMKFFLISLFNMILISQKNSK